MLHEKDEDKLKNTSRRYRCKYCDFQTHSVSELMKHVGYCNAALSDNLQQTDNSNTQITAFKTDESLEIDKQELKTSPVSALTRLGDCKATLSDNLEPQDKAHDEKEVYGELENISKCYQYNNCSFETQSLLPLTQHLDDCESTSPDNFEQIDVFHEEGNDESHNILKCYRCRDCDFETFSVLPFMKHDCNVTFGDNLPQKGMFSIIKIKNTNNLQVVITDKIKMSEDVTQPFEVICSNDDEELLKEIIDKRMNVVLTRIDVPKNEDSKTLEETSKPKYKKKRNCCFYCKELFLNVSTHFENKHSKEEEVQQILSLRKGCRERKKIIEKLRRLGNFEYNRSRGFKEIITCRRLSARKNEDFMPCSNCRGYFSKTGLRRHFRRCTEIKDTKRNVMILSKTLKFNYMEEACKRLKTNILPVLRSDEITEIIVNDSFMIMYGNHLCYKFGSSSNFDLHIRSILRTLGRLYVEIKMRNSQIKLFELLFDPSYFKNICDAIDNLGKKDPESCVYATPTTALNLGMWFKKSVEFYIILCIRDDKLEERTKAECLLILMQQMVDIIKERVTKKKKDVLPA